MKTPDRDHPITVTPTARRVRVTYRGKAIADTTRALELKEAGYPPVFYVPRADADMTLLQRTEHRTHCPHKGDGSYFSIVAQSGEADNAVWSYERPFPALAAIKDHLAFYPDRVDVAVDPA